MQMDVKTSLNLGHVVALQGYNHECINEGYGGHEEKHTPTRCHVHGNRCEVRALLSIMFATFKS